MPDAPAWSRRRVVAVLAGVTAMAVLLCGGLGYAWWDATTDPSTSVPSTTITVDDRPVGPRVRDEIAAAPLPSEGAATGLAGLGSPGPAAMTVPAPTRLGPAGVPTGYPRTPAGAVGQLAAIDATVLTTMAVQRAGQVHAAWALPGAPPVTDWMIARNVDAFLTAAAAGPAAGTDPAVTVTPIAAQVKGVDGPDWVLACVLLRVRATLATTASILYGHCERMAWHEGRWQIAPGAAPPPIPTNRPGEPVAVGSGWRPWAEPAEVTHRGTD
ncbi:hypothetical protein [Phycicoccus avicenniae]|uniref:hypothetical protein n=1 Tax=Phycicoccus avicenniae TaxID=2828860 RepID=UPI003D265B71